LFDCPEKRILVHERVIKKWLIGGREVYPLARLGMCISLMLKWIISCDCTRPLRFENLKIPSLNWKRITIFLIIRHSLLREGLFLRSKVYRCSLNRDSLEYGSKKVMKIIAILSIRNKFIISGFNEWAGTFPSQTQKQLI